MRYLSISFSIFCLLIVNSALASPHQLGFSGPLSGSGAAWGNDARNVLLFASEKLAPGKYSFVFEDDRCDPKTSRTVAQKLISKDKVKQVFVVCGQAVLGTAQEYRRAGVTVMAPLATPSRISELGVFRTGLSDAIAGRKLAQEIAKAHKEIYVLSEQNDYPQEFLKDFTKASNEASLKVVNEDFLPDQQDFRSQLLRLKNRNVTALFLNTQTELTLGALVKQLKELNMAPKLYGAYLPGSARFLALIGNLADGLIFIDFPDAEVLLNEEGKRLYQEYLQRHGTLAGWSYTFPATFEAFRAFDLAINSGKPVEEFLHSEKLLGVMGEYTFNQHGDIVGPEHAMRVIKNGKNVPY